jgi:uncharacterized LabA/DUF88 family protein
VAKRVCFIVDGFNLYHSLKEIEQKQGQRCHWLDLPGLCSSYLYLVGGGAVLGRVYYFSALATHRSSGTVARHQIFIEALEARGVMVGLGNFKAKDLYQVCPACGRHIRFKRHEEKETDVNIAVKLVEVVSDGSCDAVVVVTGDTDLVPAVAAARRLQPKVDVYMLFPTNRSNLAFDGVATGTFKIAGKQYAKYQLPDPVLAANGRTIRKPPGW